MPDLDMKVISHQAEDYSITYYGGHSTEYISTPLKWYHYLIPPVALFKHLRDQITCISLNRRGNGYYTDTFHPPIITVRFIPRYKYTRILKTIPVARVIDEKTVIDPADYEDVENKVWAFTIKDFGNEELMTREDYTEKFLILGVQGIRTGTRYIFDSEKFYLRLRENIQKLEHRLKMNAQLYATKILNLDS